MQDEFTHILRALQDIIAESANRPTPIHLPARETQANEEVQRNIALAKFYAEQLGIQIWEITRWLESGEVKRQVSQARPRGRERRARTGLNRTQ